MASSDFPENAKKFIYDFIDSVNLLEALIMVSQHTGKMWTAEILSREMRSSPTVAADCLHRLHRLGALLENAPGEFAYSPKTSELADTIRILAELYQSRPQRMLELIFSPLKQARLISEGFRITQKNPKKGEDNG